MAKLSSLKLKMGQMQYEKQRKEQKIQALKVGIPQGGSCLWLFLHCNFAFWHFKVETFHIYSCHVEYFIINAVAFSVAPESKYILRPLLMSLFTHVTTESNF